MLPLSISFIVSWWSLEPCVELIDWIEKNTHKSSIYLSIYLNLVVGNIGEISPLVSAEPGLLILGKTTAKRVAALLRTLQYFFFFVVKYNKIHFWNPFFFFSFCRASEVCKRLIATAGDLVLTPLTLLNYRAVKEGPGERTLIREAVEHANYLLFQRSKKWPLYQCILTIFFQLRALIKHVYPDNV